MDELKYFMNENKIVVMALSETHLSSTICDDEVFIDGYNIFRNDRKNNGRHGGGVAFFVREDVAVTYLDDLNIDGHESLWIKVVVDNKNVVFGVCYRPPNQNLEDIDFFVNGLYATLDTLNERYKCPLILQGDFNDRCESWESDHAI